MFIIKHRLNRFYVLKKKDSFQDHERHICWSDVVPILLVLIHFFLLFLHFVHHSFQKNYIFFSSSFRNFFQFAILKKKKKKKNCFLPCQAIKLVSFMLLLLQSVCVYTLHTLYIFDSRKGIYLGRCLSAKFRRKSMNIFQQFILKPF